MTREVICISLGQAGVQMSSAVWELLCLEHGIAPDGSIMDNLTLSDGEKDTIQTFYSEGSGGSFVPRSVLADLEPTVVDEVRIGAYRNLYHPDTILNTIEDAANNYARGHFTTGKVLLDPVLQQVRNQAMKANNLQGFLFFNSLGGGTGSGFANLLLERLNVEFGKCCTVLINIMPGPTLSTAVVEPYNMTLYTHGAIEHSDISILLDNEAIYKICKNNLGQSRPTFSNLNRIMAQITSSITCSIRYQNLLNSDLVQLQTNMVPYPRIHFPITSYAPIASQQHADHESYSAMQAIRDVFDPSSRMVSCDTSLGKFMACSLQFRGDVSPRSMNSAIQDIKRQPSIEFVDWSPTGFKVGLCTRPPCCAPGSLMAASDLSCLMLSNSSAIGDVFAQQQAKFDLLFSKRAFVHWYVGEGMEEGELNEAKEDIDALTRDYQEVAEPTDKDDEDHNEQPEEIAAEGEIAEENESLQEEQEDDVNQESRDQFNFNEEEGELEEEEEKEKKGGNAAESQERNFEEADDNEENNLIDENAQEDDDDGLQLEMI